MRIPRCASSMWRTAPTRSSAGQSFSAWGAATSISERRSDVGRRGRDDGMSDPRRLLEEIDGRAKAATPGPWWFDAHRDREGGYLSAGPRDGRALAAASTVDDPRLLFNGEVEPTHDGHFIAHARSDVPRLAAAVKVALEKADAAIASAGAATARDAVALAEEIRTAGAHALESH